MKNPWTKCKWLDFHKAAAIIIPERYLPDWNGFYLPMNKKDRGTPDLELPGRRYSISTEFDFKKPKTDYDRACKAILHRTHTLLSVGRGMGLVLAGIGPVTYCASAQVIGFNDGDLPDLDRLDELSWEHQLIWEPGDTHLILMNACLHGADPEVDDSERIRFGLEAGKYSVTSARQGGIIRFRKRG